MERDRGKIKESRKRTSTRRAKVATPIEDPPRVIANATWERGILRNEITPDSGKKTKENKRKQLMTIGEST